MKTATPKTWPKGPTTASLFIAYMLVLQSLAVGLATTPGSLRGGLFASGVCLTGSEAQASGGDRSAPTKTGGHAGDQCCVFHHAGAGVPPAAAFAEAPQRSYGALADWTSAATLAFSPWPTLPVGSRAPPTYIL